MKKRILATILTLSMVFSLAACGSKEETKEPAAAQTEDAAVAQEEAKPAEGAENWCFSSEPDKCVFSADCRWHRIGNQR